MFHAAQLFVCKQPFERNPRSKQRYEKAREEAKNVGPDIKQAVQKLKEADDEAENARLDAEDTFEEAERQLSASLAREGARKAIHSWELRMKAIRKAEALAKKAMIANQTL